MSQVSMYDKAGKKVGSVKIDAKPVEQTAFRAYATAIRALLQNWRQGTVGVKTRGEVAMTNKKPWKQKGTGRARAGTSRSPLWRKGGVTFGPQMRVRELALPKSQRRLAMRALLSEFTSGDRIKGIEFELNGKPSTKEAAQVLSTLGLQDKKLVLFLSREDTTMYLSFRNLPNVHVVFFDQPNAFDLSNAQNWCFLKKDAELFTDMVGKWN